MFVRNVFASTGRADELARRHAEWFADITCAADAELRTAGEAAAQLLRRHFYPRRAARRRDWAFDHDLGLAAGLSAHLYVYAEARFVDEPLLWQSNSSTGSPPTILTVPSSSLRPPRGLIRRGNIADARRLAYEAVERAGESPHA